ncbi:MAG: DUF2062 domain-containing protein [Pseudomonadota bacterium]
MIFKRRQPPTISTRARELVYPRKGFWRGFGYLGKRIRRLPDSPHRIALGFACGALASFTPFFGFHFFVAAGLAWALRANVVAGLFGTIVGNPFTFPFISTASLYVGRLILGRGEGGSDFEAVTDAFGDAFNSIWQTMKSWVGYGPSMVDGLLAFFDEVFLPYLIGGAIPGLVTGAICYIIIGPAVDAYQTRRRKKLEEAQAARRREIDRELEAYATHDAGEGDNA